MNFNLIRDPADERDFRLGSILGRPKIRRKLDWSRLMSPVKDQGTLGSCAAFATVAMKEYEEFRERQKPNIPNVYDFSEQWVYYMAKKIDDWPDQEGTSLKYTMKVLKDIGVPTEEAWPYNDAEIGEPLEWASMVAKWYVIDSYWRVQGLREILAALDKSGPFPIGIEVFSNIYSTTGDGIIPYPNPTSKSEGGHAVCLVGYNNKRELLKFKNSWSLEWGLDGYGFISYKYARDFLWDAWVAKDFIEVTGPTEKMQRIIEENRGNA